MKIGFSHIPTFAARYTSECANCGIDIQPGDQARYDEDDEVVHVDCPELASTDEKPCTECWLIHTGECP
ncbi:hypothetical protein [Mycolicibacter kumamotonensis]|uniref:Uncharacterized protein n=1 Tax=Mycolicibacter kumamotonensis TaxID=354243 RepID=A0A1B8SL73_9MYCO|nr:hypothetical protein [Mycolicibacter kumamotonensis]OBY33489.1 hypothetical protein ACT18_00650 [Mycolicibacter kumamotonensis]